MESWLHRFVLMLDGLLGAESPASAPPGGLLFLAFAGIGYALAAVFVST